MNLFLSGPLARGAGPPPSPDLGLFGSEFLLVGSERIPQPVGYADFLEGVRCHAYRDVVPFYDNYLIIACSVAPVLLPQ